jgi:hydroxypyruvate isomerase
MLRFSANLGLLYADVPLVERFQKAADAGFRVVEIWFTHLENLDAVVNAKNVAGVEILQFNMDRIDFANGERGTLSIPDQAHRFRADLEIAIETARRLGARQFNALVGNQSSTATREQQLACLQDNLRWAATRLAGTNLRLVVEPLSAVINPGYLITRPRELLGIIRGIGSPKVAVLYDIFHAQMGEGNLVTTIREHLPWIGHIQAADAPGRHQPGTGEINYPFVLTEIEAMGYEGHIGLEYRPRGTTDESLAWLPREGRVTTNASALRW